MADEFQSTGICSGNWWNSTRNNNIGISSSSSSPCSTTTLTGSYGNWQSLTNNQTVDIKLSKPHHHHQAAAGSSSDSVSGTHDHHVTDSLNLMDNTNLQILGFDLSSPLTTTSDWTQTLLHSNRNDHEIHHHQHQHQNQHHHKKEWSSNNNSSGIEDSSSIHSSFKQQQINNEGFNLVDPHDHYYFNSNKITSSENNNNNNCTTDLLPMSFLMNNSGSYESTSTPSSSTSMLLQGLYDDPNKQQLHHHQQSSYEEDNNNNRTIMNYSTSTSTNNNNYHQLSPTYSNWSSKFTQFLKTESSNKILQPASSNNQTLHFISNNITPFWNSAASSSSTTTTTMTHDDIPSTLFSSQQTQFLTPILDDQKPNCSNNLSLKPNTTEEVQESSSSVVKKSSNEPASSKRPRIETPLPTFKVRKEKLGDRITALQQLCSPFGKTDTASVLYEAIEYIKFLHEQVTVLSNPYMKNGDPIQYQQNLDRSKNGDGMRKDLRSRGLCLVPISSTFTVTNEANTDFWTPTFGGTYR